jgi:hypothetical protein
MLLCHGSKLGLEGIVSKRLGSPYRSGRSRHWVKSKNPAVPAVKREAEEDGGSAQISGPFSSQKILFVRRQKGRTAHEQ